MIPKYIVGGLIGFLVDGNLIVCAEGSSSSYRVSVEGYPKEFKAACANPCCRKSFTKFNELLDLVGRERVKRVWVRNAQVDSWPRQTDIDALAQGRPLSGGISISRR